MTIQEINNAKRAYWQSVQGKEILLKLISSCKINQFVTTYMRDFNSSQITSISDDYILQTSFLSESHNTKASNNLMVYLNNIERLDSSIDAEKPILNSVDWNVLHKEESKNLPNSLPIFKLYCDLETDRPVLIGQDDFEKFQQKSNIIELPNYTPKKEEYYYNDNGLSSITKGSASEMYNRLQLYFYRELLTKKQEEVVARILKKDTLENVCLGK